MSSQDDTISTRQKVGLALAMVLGVAALGVFVWYFALRDTSGGGNNNAGAGAGSTSGGLSTGALIGIMAGVGLLAIGLGGFYVYNKRNSQTGTENPPKPKPQSKSGTEPAVSLNDKTSRKNSVFSRTSSRRFSNPATVNSTIEDLITDAGSISGVSLPPPTPSVPGSGTEVGEETENQPRNSVTSERTTGSRNSGSSRQTSQSQSSVDPSTLPVNQKRLLFGGEPKNPSTSSQLSSDTENPTATESQTPNNRSQREVDFIPEKPDDFFGYGSSDNSVSTRGELAGDIVNAVTTVDDPDFDFGTEAKRLRTGFSSAYNVFVQTKDVDPKNLRSSVGERYPDLELARKFLKADDYYKSRIVILNYLAKFYLDNEASKRKKRFEQCVKIRNGLMAEYKYFSTNLSPELRKKIDKAKDNEGSLVNEGKPFVSLEEGESVTRMVESKIRRLLKIVEMKETEEINEKLGEARDLFTKFEQNFMEGNRDALEKDIEKTEEANREVEGR